MCVAERIRCMLVRALLPGLALLCAACGPMKIGGTYLVELRDQPAVPLSDLTRYYRERTNGLILPAVSDTAMRASRLTFTADPFNGRRIVAPPYCSWEEIQNLYVLNQDTFVARYGAADLLSATRAAYAALPFDEQRGVAVKPYRTLAAWGGLLYPPVKHLDHPLAFYDTRLGSDPTTGWSGSAYFDPAFQEALDRETQTSLTAGNTLRALFNGVQSYPEKLRLVREARMSLYVGVMAIVADSSGRALVKAMVARKRAGVDVRVIVDDFYTFSISSFAIGVLERAGVPVARVADKRLNQMDRMFHNKFWIRDGEEAILGGMNVLDYENTATGFDFQNRDTDILFQGPAVTDLLADFIGLWKRYDREGISIAAADSLMFARKEAERAAGLRGIEHYAAWLNDPVMRTRGLCRVAVQGDDADTQTIATLLTRYTEKAQHSFLVKTPGVECTLTGPPSSAIDVLAGVMLEKCRQPGFHGTFITNGADGGWGESTIFLRSRVWDSELIGDPMWVDVMTPVIDGAGREVALATRRVTRPFLEAGGHVYAYMNYIHSKEFAFDRLLVGIGSWNFDPYSADNNHECAIFCLDEALRKQMEHQMVLDLVNSVPVTPPLRSFHH
jgi:phosphatidylserine/phosphatidylglycerophosphate/cardiolipin synthase-like enzyme